MSECSPSTHSWPEWLLAAGPDMPLVLQSIGEACERLRKSVEDGHVYRHVMQTQLTAVSDEMIARGIIDTEGRILKPGVVLPKWFSAATAYQHGAAYRMLGMFIIAEQMAIVQLTNSIRASIQDSSLLAAMLCLRGVLEQVAHFDSVLHGIAHYTTSVPSDPNESNQLIAEVNGFLVSRVYATRVDWDGLLFGETEKLLQKKDKLGYKPNKLRQDRMADSVMNDIDRLSKRIRGVRGVYEVLCEFAHPNLGLVMGLTRNVHPVADKHGFHWIHEELSLDSPLAAVASLGKILNHSFAIVAECILHFEDLLIKAERSRTVIQQVSQVTLRHLFATHRDIVDPYAVCPCGSGSKVRFCCGMKP